MSRSGTPGFDTEAPLNIKEINEYIQNFESENSKIDKQISEELSGMEYEETDEETEARYQGPNTGQGTWTRDSDGQIRLQENILTDKIAVTRQIAQEAFNQKAIDLKKEISDNNMKALILLLTERQTNQIKKYQNFINGKFTILLRPLIPSALMNCWKKWPGSIRMAPGFLYRASEKYGNNLTFWVTPNVPYFIEQGKELDTLTENNGLSFLGLVDEAVVRFYEAINKRAEKESLIVSVILQSNINTYYDLLKHKPMWYKTLYNYLIRTGDYES